MTEELKNAQALRDALFTVSTTLCPSSEFLEVGLKPRKGFILPASDSGAVQLIARGGRGCQLFKERLEKYMKELICFPWAGGGTSQLAQWGRLFNDSIEVFCIRLPGRETRLGEPFPKDMTSLVNEITSVLLKELKEKPFVFFGHSLGMYTSFAVALHLKEKYGLEPVHLFVSAAHAPNSAAHLALKSTPMPDGNNDLLACVGMLGGNFELPPNEDFRRNIVLAFREDAKVFKTFSFEKADMNTPFSCDVTCFRGSDDKIYDVQGWQELTNGDVSFYELPGDHFYLLKPSNESFLIKHITTCIENASI